MRLIAVESFTETSGVWHPYGHEFSMDDSAERAALLAAGTIREDDRLTTGRVPEPPATEP